MWLALSDRVPRLFEIDLRLIPFLTSIVTIIVLCVHALVYHARRRVKHAESGSSTGLSDGIGGGFFARKLKSLGGPRIALFVVADFLISLALWALSVSTILKEGGP